MHGLTLWLVLALFLLVSIEAWPTQWNLSKRFKAIGHNELECDGKTHPAACCICRSVVFEIETQLNNTVDDYEMDVVFRISEEKKKIRRSRSEDRILEVLESVCDSLPMELPESNTKKMKLLNRACTSFVGTFDDQLTKVFFNNHSPATNRMCSDTIGVCPRMENKDEL